MNQPLKAPLVSLEEDIKQIETAVENQAAKQQTKPAAPKGEAASSGKDIEQIRAKIKAARLEKLMARQLESEFTPTSEISEEAPMPLPRPVVVHTTPEINLKSCSDSLNVLEHNKQANSELITDIRNSSELISKIAQQAGGLTDYLRSVEVELSSYAKLENDNKSLRQKVEIFETEHHDAALMIEKQKKQIDFLESLRTSSEANYENMKQENHKLEQENRRFTGDLDEKKMQVAKLENHTRSLKDTLSEVENERSDLSHKISAREEDAQKSRIELTRAQAELDRVTTSNEQALLELGDLQTKYNNLNKRNLEQQSDQFTRINELETQLRDAKRQLELKAQEKAEMKVELEATNNLLALHEEMIAALSPENRK